jgi:gluconate 5-dehydrogenase
MFAAETNAALAENPDMVAFARQRVALGRPEDIAGAALASPAMRPPSSTDMS